MKNILKVLSLAGLLLTLLPAILYFYGYITPEILKGLMAAGMVLWFMTAPFWLNESEKSRQ